MRLEFARVTDTHWHLWVAEQMRRHGWKNQAEAARATGLNRSVLSRWLDPKHPQPSMRNCRLAARAFGVPLLNVLVAAGHLTPEEAGIPPDPMPPRSVEEMTALEVAVELQRKIAEEMLGATRPERVQGDGDGDGGDDNDDDDVMLYRAQWPPPDSVPPVDPEDPRRASGDD